MKLYYQVATPDVAAAPSVTAFQGSLEQTFSALAGMGYAGVELMTLDPGKLGWDEVRKTALKYGLEIALVCTGEVYGQLGLSFTDEDPLVRQEAQRRVCGIIDFAAHLGAKVNIGRVRGVYRDAVPREQTYDWAVEAFRNISRHAASRDVQLALEPVTILQTNFINTVAEAAQMVDDVAMENFRLMMDIFHMNIEEKDLFSTICDYARYNIHVHLADNNRRYPGHCGLDFKRVIRTFHEVGYRGAFCTEIYQIPDQETAARAAIGHLAPIIAAVYGE